MRRDTRGSREVGVIARDHAPTPRAMRLPIRPWHPCRGWPDVSSGRKEGREMHGGLLWAAFEEWAAHHHSARRSVGLHRHAASEPHRLLLGPVPAAGRPARQRAWPTWPRLKHMGIHRDSRPSRQGRPARKEWHLRSPRADSACSALRTQGAQPQTSNEQGELGPGQRIRWGSSSLHHSPDSWALAEVARASAPRRRGRHLHRRECARRATRTSRTRGREGHRGPRCRPGGRR